mmetsp:Transcript_31772/g.80329  ORF Transcript_31772/g.80329 Transcript_31772/m.80329 type:complete len:247 (+) Transcript_31772:142-882(+)
MRMVRISVPRMCRGISLVIPMAPQACMDLSMASVAISVAKNFNMLASVFTSMPLSCFQAQSRAMTLVAWILLAMSATHHWMACLSASFDPKSVRWFACSMSISKARRAMPMDHAAISKRLLVSLVCMGAKPLPISPNKLAAGILQSSSTSSYVTCPPSILISLDTVIPGVPASTKKAVMPPGPPSPGSAWAMRITWSITSPRVIQILVPFSTQLSPFFTAFICILLGSAPAPGSEMPIAETVSPLE